MNKLIEIFKLNNFKKANEATKSIEFVHNQSKEVVYLLPNIELTVALNPEKVEGDVELENKTSGLIHNTSFREFAKRKNTGKEPIHYGYSFKFQSPEELSSFLRSHF